MAWLTVDVSAHQVANALFDDDELFVDVIEDAAYRHNKDSIKNQRPFLERVTSEISDEGMDFLRDLVAALEKTREAL